MSDDEPTVDPDDPDGTDGDDERVSEDGAESDAAADERATSGASGGPSEASSSETSSAAASEDGAAEDGPSEATSPEGPTGGSGSADGETAPWMTAGTGAEEPTLADIAAEEEKPEGTPSIGYLPSLPETFVTLGAGCLATASLLSLVAFGFVLWMRTTGNVRELLPWELTLAAILMGFSTVMLAAGSYFALKRIRWTLTMLAAMVGSFAIVTIPFTAVAVFCIGLSRVHFTQPFVGDVSPDAGGPGAEVDE